MDLISLIFIYVPPNQRCILILLYFNIQKLKIIYKKSKKVSLLICAKQKNVKKLSKNAKKWEFGIDINANSVV